MKIRNKIAFISLSILIGLLCVHLGGQDAFASEGADNWRHNYDLFMRWLNFGILAFVIYKFGKPPLMNFLHGQKDQLSREINDLEEERAKINTKIDEIQGVLDKGEAHYADLKDRIIRQGEKKKQEIIDDAKKQSKIMLETSKQKISNQIIQAQRTFKSELVDAAIALAEKRLPAEITDDDNQNFIGDYLAGAALK